MFHYTYLRADCRRDGVHTVQQKHFPSYIMQRPCFNTLLIVFRFGDAISPEQLNNYPGLQILLFRTEIRGNKFSWRN